MTKYQIAPPGTNPMDQPEKYKRNVSAKMQLAMALLGLAALLGICGFSVYWVIKPKPAAAVGLATATITQTPSSTATGTLLATATVTQTPRPTSTGTLLPTATVTPTSSPAATQTPWKVEITKVVYRNGANVEVTRIVEKTVVVEMEVTFIPPTELKPQPTQTPWVIVITQPVEVTRIVEVTPTETPTLPPTETPTASPTATAEMVVDLQPYPPPP